MKPAPQALSEQTATRHAEVYMTCLHRLTRSPAALAGLLTLGCAALLSPRELRVDAVAINTAVTADDPATIQVTARNTGDRAVTWGPGSSTCWFHLLVRVDGKEHVAADGRICTADRARHVLAPGESRTETIPWAGTVHRSETPMEPLEPGTYEVRGSAGSTAISPPVLIEVRAEP